jgi:hypothetical protein
MVAQLAVNSNAGLKERQIAQGIVLLDVIKVAVNLKIEIRQDQMQKAVLHTDLPIISSHVAHKAIRAMICKAQRKPQTQKTCLRQRDTRPCHNRLCLHLKAPIMATLIVAMLTIQTMAARPEATPTLAANTEAAVEVAKL